MNYHYSLLLHLLHLPKISGNNGKWVFWMGWVMNQKWGNDMFMAQVKVKVNVQQLKKNTSGRNACWPLDTGLCAYYMRVSSRIYWSVRKYFSIIELIWYVNVNLLLRLFHAYNLLFMISSNIPFKIKQSCYSHI